jgi:MoxR-like ATPase
VEEEALQFISLLALQTWPEDLPLAKGIHEGLDILNDITQESFQSKRLELQQKINENVQMGIGPRGVQTLLVAIKVLAALENRETVTAAFVVDNVKKVLKEAWRHRLLLNFHAENNRITTDDILDVLLDNLWEP